MSDEAMKKFLPETTMAGVVDTKAMFERLKREGAATASPIEKLTALYFMHFDKTQAIIRSGGGMSAADFMGHSLSIVGALCGGLMAEVGMSDKDAGRFIAEAAKAAAENMEFNYAAVSDARRAKKEQANG